MNQEKFKLALVTGASSGIGEALSRLLAKQGINLLITGRNIEKLDSLQNELGRFVEVTVFVADLATQSGCDRVVDKIKEFLPDLVVNNAGLGIYGDCLTIPTETQMRILEVNGVALQKMTLESAKIMVSNSIKGVILNVSSAGAFQIFPFFSAYTATKAFVNHLSVSLDYELRSHGVRVLTSCPGMVATNFSKRSGGKTNSGEPGVMPVEKAANEVWWQICKRKQLHVFDWRYRLATTLSQFIPKWLLAKILMKVIKNKSRSEKSN